MCSRIALLLLVPALAAPGSLQGGEPEGAPTTRRALGGVLPRTNDGTSPGGTEEGGWPLPFADVLDEGTGELLATDSGGNLAVCVDGDATSTLDGPFVRVIDSCGPIELTTAGDLDFGTSPSTNCSTPGFGGAGNTRAARTAFYHVNRVKEVARGPLPDLPWLAETLTARTNIALFCGANWTGGEIRLFTGGGGCANTGEMADVIVHEMGHGFDQFDASPGISNPSEGIADVYAALYTAGSCIGEGFRPGNPCAGYGDPCTTCDGVREIDWALRQSGQPHDIAFIDANCGSGGVGPCGGNAFCEGAVVAEAVWDLYARDLPAFYGLGSDTSLELATRLTLLGAGGVGTWFNCTNGTGTGDGCNANGGYLGFLAADDDDANLGNGTPHMQAIFAAFDRHGIACPTPAVVDSGCAGAPTAAPAVIAQPADRGALLTWNAVAGAAHYRVLRAEGGFGCDTSKALAGETAGTSFVDEGLQNGRAYSYAVVPVGGHDTCLGPASACTDVTPAPGPNLSIDPASCTLTILGGDGDPFLDNCERGRICCALTNIGNATLTDVEIAAVEVLEGAVSVVAGPGTVVEPSLGVCDTGQACFEVLADGLAPGEPVRLRLDLTSPELLPLTKSAETAFDLTEGDLQLLASHTFSFEADLEGWTVAEGSFARRSDGPGSGGGGTDTFLESSALLARACDRVRSPRLRLAATSTLSVATNFDIEPMSAGSWYDRANLAVLDGAGVRTPAVPDSGRLYAATAGDGSCLEDEPGWSGPEPTWAASGWSAAALGSGSLAGELVRLEAAYGTDAALSNRGFWLDEVTLTDLELEVPDAQSDVCLPPEPIFTDGFESGSTAAWTLEVAGP